jgi:hypothetical protein
LDGILYYFQLTNQQQAYQISSIKNDHMQRAVFRFVNISNYLWNQCLSSLTWWVRIPLMFKKNRCGRICKKLPTIWWITSLVDNVLDGILLIDWFMVFYATFNNISVISWWSVLLKETRESHWPVPSHWQILPHLFFLKNNCAVDQTTFTIYDKEINLVLDKMSIQECQIPVAMVMFVGYIDESKNSSLHVIVFNTRDLVGLLLIG